jgi:hypothetical protein
MVIRGANQKLKIDWRTHNATTKKSKGQWSTKHYTERSTNTNPTKTGGELGFSGKVNSSCSTSDTRRDTVKRHEHYLMDVLWWMVHGILNRYSNIWRQNPKYKGNLAHVLILSYIISRVFHEDFDILSTFDFLWQIPRTNWTLKNLLHKYDFHVKLIFRTELLYIYYLSFTHVLCNVFESYNELK